MKAYITDWPTLSAISLLFLPILFCMGCTEESNATCPDGEHWDGSRCVPFEELCPNGEVWTGFECVSPDEPCTDGQVWNGSTCVTTGDLCPNDQVWNGVECVPHNGGTRHRVNVTIDPLEGGAIAGAGYYEHGVEVIVAATPSIDFTFLGWYADERMSDSRIYRFVIDSDVDLIARFASSQNPMALVTLVAHPPHAGGLTGGGPYLVGEEVVIRATANTGYRFYGWHQDDDLLSQSANYSFILERDVSLTARFDSVPVYTITVTADPAEGGFPIGAGAYLEDQQVSLYARPNAGFRFDGWHENGVLLDSASTHGFVATSDRALVARYSVSTTPEPPGPLPADNGIFAEYWAGELTTGQLNSTYMESLFALDYINGIHLRVQWNHYHLAENVFDFSQLHEALRLAANAGKKVSLMIPIASYGLPAWVAQSSQTFQFTHTHPSVGVRTAPVPWDEQYIAAVTTFIGELASRYDGHPNLHSVQISGPSTLFGVETNWPWRPESVSAADMNILGFSLQKYEDTWKRFIDIFMDQLPNTSLKLAMHDHVWGGTAAEQAQTVKRIRDYFISSYTSQRGQKPFINLLGLNADSEHYFIDETTVTPYISLAWEVRDEARLGYETFRILSASPTCTPEFFQKVMRNGIAFRGEHIIVKFLDVLSTSQPFQPYEPYVGSLIDTAISLGALPGNRLLEDFQTGSMDSRWSWSYTHAQTGAIHNPTSPGADAPTLSIHSPGANGQSYSLSYRYSGDHIYHLIFTPEAHIDDWEPNGLSFYLRSDSGYQWVIVEIYESGSRPVWRAVVPKAGEPSIGQQWSHHEVLNSDFEDHPLWGPESPDAVPNFSGLHQIRLIMTAAGATPSPTRSLYLDQLHLIRR